MTESGEWNNTPASSVSTGTPLRLTGDRNGTPLQYSCLENPVDRGAWWAAVHGVTESWTRLKWFSMHACIGEGNGNPLQCSCLENPRDGEAWWAAVYGVAQSRTRLKRLSSSSSSSGLLCISCEFPNRTNFSCAKWLLSWLCTFFFPSSHFNLTFLAPLILCHGLISSIHNLNSNLCLGVSSWRNLNCDSDYFGRLKLNFQLECLLLLGKQVMRWIKIPTVQTLVSFSHKCSNISDKQVMFTSNFFSKLWHSWGWPFSLGIGYGNSRRDAWASCPVLASSSRLKLWKEPDGFRTEIPNCKLGPSISYLLNFK